jgi:hypothetical protein
MKMNSSVNYTAADFLGSAAAVMQERGKQYDQPEGERSMGKVVAAFNAITGHTLTESEGWLIICLLKMVRQWQNPDKAHEDSLLDGVAYAALLAESVMCSSMSTPSGIMDSATGE